MPNLTNPGGADPPDVLDERLQSLAEPPIPDDLLRRCLSTIRRSRVELITLWTLRAAAALLVFLGVAFAVVWSRPVDAADVLKSVKIAWTKVDASHRVLRSTFSNVTRTEEIWFVRGKGRRKETRSQDELVRLVVNNGRWEFRWDVRSKLVAAWSTALLDDRREPHAAGLELDSEAFVKWAESNRGVIRIEADSLAGRPVRKVVVNQPRPEGGGAAAPVITVWFDPDSLLPLKQRQESATPNEGVAEMIIDYPAPSAVRDDLFKFTMPRDVVLEINDPDLQRQVYSEAQKKGEER